MPDMREGGLGTAACYLTVERLALQAGVESPFWDETSLLMGGCDEPWYKKPLTPRRLRSFLKRYGGSLPDDAGRTAIFLSISWGLFSTSPPRRPMRARSTSPRRTRPARAARPIAPSMTWASASRLSSRRYAASTSMSGGTERPGGMSHPMSGAAIGTGTGPVRGRTPPVLKSSGSRRRW